MTVNGTPNVRACVEPLVEGMDVRRQPATGGEPSGKNSIAGGGGGPAGLAAADTAASLGIQVLLVDEGRSLVGQLVKQTHKFLGSGEHHAGVRGIDIPQLLPKEGQDKITFKLNTTVIGCYQDRVLTALTGEDEYFKISPQAAILATGASEKFLAFPGK